MTTRINQWLTAFAADPSRVWNDCVVGLRPVPGYERADMADTLEMVFGGLPVNDDKRAILDVTLTAWMDTFLQWNASKRREFGFSRYSLWLVEVMIAASRLRLPRFNQYAMDNLVRLRGVLQPLVLAPQRDPLATLYRTLASSPEHAPRLENFWLGLCRQADDQLPGHYLTIGLLGLQQCQPHFNGGAFPWIGGLSAWLPHTQSQNHFSGKFRSMRALYPRSPTQWRQWIEPVLTALQGRVAEERLEWWRQELGRVAVVKSQQWSQPLKSPYPQDLTKVLQTLDTSDNQEKATRSLKELFARHDRYVEQTGDTYYFVRAVAEAVKELLHRRQGWMSVLALSLVRRALVLEPWDNVCWQLYGRCLVVVGCAPEAAEWVFWEAIRRFPNSIQNYTELGRLLVAQDRKAEAEGMFREALEIDARNIHCRTELGRLLVAQGRNDEAEGMFREALEIDSKNLHCYTELGCLLVAKGYNDEAEWMFRKALEINPQDRHSRTELGCLLERSNRLDDAKSVFQEGVRIAPDDEFYLIGLQRVRDKIIGLAQDEKPSFPYEREKQIFHNEIINPVSNQASSFFAELRPPALAKRADFFLSAPESVQNQELRQKVKEQFEKLLISDGNHGVVQFYGRRHAFLGGQESGNLSANVAWELEEATQCVDGTQRRDALMNVAAKLTGKLAEWVCLAAGEEAQWPLLQQWHQSEKQESDSHTNDFVRSELQRVLQQGTSLPPEALLLASLRRAAEMLLSAGTEPVMEEGGCAQQSLSA